MNRALTKKIKSKHLKSEINEKGLGAADTPTRLQSINNQTDGTSGSMPMLFKTPKV